MIELVLLTVLLTTVYCSDQVPTKTVVDVLSENPQFSEFLGALQKEGLVPFLNQRWNVTLLAPVNSAFLSAKDYDLSRQELLYYLLNVTVTSSDFADEMLLPSFADKDDKAYPVLLKGHSVNNGLSEIVDFDLKASSERGIVQGLSDLLPLPEPLCSKVFLYDNLSIFGHLLIESEFCKNAPTSDGMTLFAPTDSSLYSDFEVIQYEYLMSKYGSEDREKFIRHHIISDIVAPQLLPGQFYLLDGTLVDLDKDHHINRTHVLDSWEVAAGGTLNIIDASLGIPISWTAEKYLQALGAETFVHEAHLYGYEAKINGSSKNHQTILVTSNPSAPWSRAAGSSYDHYLYQFIDSQLHLSISVGKPHTGDSWSALLNTHMPLKSGLYPQRVHLDHHVSGSTYVNWQHIKSREYVVGNSSIYLIDGILPIPPSLLSAVGPLLSNSYSLEYLEKLDLATLPVENSWTLFLPIRDAWERNILIKKYMDSNQTALELMFDNLILRAPIYSDSNKTVVKQAGGHPLLIEPKDNGFLVNDSVFYEVDVPDVLFDNGVVHFSSNFYLPDNLEISAEDLVKAGEREIFLELIEAAGLRDLLSDCATNKTFIVPPPRDLHRHNYTTESDPEKLQEMLKLHIIEGNPFLDGIPDGTVVTTISNEGLEVTKIAENTLSLLLKSGSGQQVFATLMSNTNGVLCSGSTVLFVNRLISPSWIFHSPFGIHTHTALIIGLILGLMAGFGGVVVIVYAFFSDNSKISDSEEQRRPLLEGEEEDTMDDDSVTHPVRTPGGSRTPEGII